MTLSLVLTVLLLVFLSRAESQVNCTRQSENQCVVPAHSEPFNYNTCYWCCHAAKCIFAGSEQIECPGDDVYNGLSNTSCPFTLSTGAIVGIVLGVAFCVGVCLCYHCCRGRKFSSQSSPASVPMGQKSQMSQQRAEEAANRTHFLEEVNLRGPSCPRCGKRVCCLSHHLHKNDPKCKNCGGSGHVVIAWCLPGTSTEVPHHTVGNSGTPKYGACPACRGSGKIEVADTCGSIVSGGCRSAYI